MSLIPFITGIGSRGRHGGEYITFGSVSGTDNHRDSDSDDESDSDNMNRSANEAGAQDYGNLIWLSESADNGDNDSDNMNRSANEAGAQDYGNLIWLSESADNDDNDSDDEREGSDMPDRAVLHVSVPTIVSTAVETSLQGPQGPQEPQESRQPRQPRQPRRATTSVRDAHWRERLRAFQRDVYTTTNYGQSFEEALQRALSFVNHTGDDMHNDVTFVSSRMEEVD